MRELSLDEFKEHELNILVDVAEFCDNHGLRYFIAYGTLIGAVRHKGFIPWDDDIDIQMPRPDYERFLKLYNVEGKNNNIYKSINPYDKDSKHTFCKVVDLSTVKIEQGISYRTGEELGIDIDIFPLDGQPDDDNEFLAYYNKKYNQYKKFSYVVNDYKERSWKGKIAFIVPYVINRIVGKRKILDRIKRYNVYEYDHSNYVGSTSCLFNSKNNRFKKEWFDNSVQLDFEGYKLKAPCGYHEILTQMYGDYMKLPPKDQQVTHHTNKAYKKRGIKNEKI